jgi:hypothetical protein
MFAQVVALALGLVACGDLNVEQPSDEDQGKGGELGESHEEASGGETSPAETTEPAENKPDPKHTATEKEKADEPVTDPAPTPIVVVDGFPIFATMNGNNACAWQECMDQAPAGYRLATRAELKALIALDLLRSFKDGELWSSTEESDTIAFFVDGDSGRDARMDKTMPLDAVYVTGATEDEQ